MTKIENDLESFNRFVREQLKAGTPDEELADLFDRWRAEHPSNAEYAANVAACKAAYARIKQGVTGRLAIETSEELRRELNLPEDE